MWDFRFSSTYYVLEAKMLHMKQENFSVVCKGYRIVLGDF